MKKQVFALLLSGVLSVSAQQPVDYVNPFIGTSNYGTTNPGAVCPQGLMSVTPFNVMGSESNKFDKDCQWWSAPYTSDNNYFTGFAHVNLSGVGHNGGSYPFYQILTDRSFPEFVSIGGVGNKTYPCHYN